MDMFAVVLALLLEQWRPATGWPLARARSALRIAIDALPDRLDGGREWHAWLGWSMAVGIPSLLAWAIGAALGLLLGLLCFVFIVGVLYFTLGFRLFSHRFTAVRDGLAARRLDLAGAALAHWQGGPLAPTGGTMPATTPETIARQAIERGVGEAGRWLFGGLFWFAVMPGASGAVLYRTADQVALRWSSAPTVGLHPGFASVAASALRWLDELPARLAAGAFALVGDFTGAAEGWQAARREGVAERGTGGPEAGPGSGPCGPRELMVAAAFGALGMGQGALNAERNASGEGAGSYDAFDGAGWDADSYALAVRQMDGAAALVWRSLLLWLAVLGLIALLA
jgi:adenosylcobinamide-phosphate synthase